MKPVTKVAFASTILFIIIITALWWILFISTLNIPEFIPHTPIKLYGFCLIVVIITLFIITEKHLIKLQPEISIIKLTFIGATISFITEVVFQSILSTTLTSDKFYFFCSGVITATIFETIISFLIAFQLKAKKTGLLIVFIITFCLLCKMMMFFYPPPIAG